ncbi:diacylglycerol kinase family protein [Croceicoccus sp. Ery5]|jgi:diacylglycerol kinase (ATP)|uniref:diacylglycerol/lipid kinase family protein n=1 Tax=Croceicoccus sp. Ery5 TaxID=1703340 RepID=UPI001E5389A5|nr:diacylglycerol kinase family protein [Croceicoccus sp. Ery5]
MDGTIYDSRSLARLAFDGSAEDLRGPVNAPAYVDRVGRAPVDASRIAVICNPRSHGVKTKGLDVPPGVDVLSPRTRADLRKTLNEFKTRGVELIIVAGGDGTVRDVLTCGGPLWQEQAPAIAVLPKGKTNALAIDLGVDPEASVADVIDAWHAGRFTMRPAIEISRPDETGAPVRGFLFGAGIFVSATDLAQTTHRFGAFNNVAVALSMLGSIANVAFGFGGSGWREGKRIGISAPGTPDSKPGMDVVGTRNRLIMLVSTMHRLPLGVRPFGRERGGMKLLATETPIPHFLVNFWRTIRGGDDAKLARAGIHRLDARELDIDVEDGFVLDGEVFPGGRYILREGAPIAFVTP